MKTTINFFCTLFFVLIVSTALGQSLSLPKPEVRTRVYTTIKGYWLRNKNIYYINVCAPAEKNSRNKLQLDLPKNVINMYTGVGDFLLYLNDKLEVDSAKLVSLEIRNRVSNRIYDWVYFTNANSIHEVDLHKLGATSQDLDQFELDKLTSTIAKSFMENLTKCITFHDVLDGKLREGNTLVYFVFSF